jgi:hypothetical protein
MEHMKKLNCVIVTQLHTFDLIKEEYPQLTSYARPDKSGSTQAYEQVL